MRDALFCSSFPFIYAHARLIVNQGEPQPRNESSNGRYLRHYSFLSLESSSSCLSIRADLTNVARTDDACTQELTDELKPRGGGGGNRTRVRGRTGQNLYKRSPRFAFDRRPEADTLPAA